MRQAGRKKIMIKSLAELVLDGNKIAVVGSFDKSYFDDFKDQIEGIIGHKVSMEPIYAPARGKAIWQDLGGDVGIIGFITENVERVTGYSLSLLNK